MDDKKSLFVLQPATITKTTVDSEETLHYLETLHHVVAITFVDITRIMHTNDSICSSSIVCLLAVMMNWRCVCVCVEEEKLERVSG